MSIEITVLTDNIPGEGLEAEWGLSLHIDYEGMSILLDTGASPLFLRNAEKLGIDIAKVQLAVLSHAHYDHADGMDAFFEKNGTALCYLRPCCENCWSDSGDKGRHYIGLRKGLLEDHSSRFRFVEGDRQLCPGVWVIPHKEGNLAEIGRKAGMLTEKDGVWFPDDFAHEHTLVLEGRDGLILLSPCSHSGADNIVREIEETFPGRKISAVIGGFHLFRSTDEEVVSFAQRLEKTGAETIVTGHCTGERAYEILKAKLGDRVQQMHTGLVLSFRGPDQGESPVEDGIIA